MYNFVEQMTYSCFHFPSGLERMCWFSLKILEIRMHSASWTDTKTPFAHLMMIFKVSKWWEKSSQIWTTTSPKVFSALDRCLKKVHLCDQRPSKEMDYGLCIYYSAMCITIRYALILCEHRLMIRSSYVQPLKSNDLFRLLLICFIAYHGT